MKASNVASHFTIFVNVSSLGIQFISYQENINTTCPLEEALFTIVSAVAQLERDLIRERVKAGLRNAKAKGRVLGRPRVAVDARAVVKLRSQGRSWIEVSRRLNLSRATAQQAAKAFSAQG